MEIGQRFVTDMHYTILNSVPSLEEDVENQRSNCKKLARIPGIGIKSHNIRVYCKINIVVDFLGIEKCPLSGKKIY